MTTLTCLSDDYLSETHLSTLFTEFQVSLRAGQADGAVFSSLVNNVRHVYLAALLRDRSDELARLRRELAEERDPLPEYRPVTTDTVGSSNTEAPAPARGGGEMAPVPTAGLAPPPAEEICWPAKTFTLYIGSYSEDHRRDMPDWVCMDKDGWTERMNFQVFRYEEPETIRIDVTEQFDSHRIMVNRNHQAWKPRLTFYAYGQPRPGTQYIWVAFRADPDRCIFLKGKPEDRLEGWERRLEFWVPK